MTNGYQIARFNRSVFVRVLGLANMKNTPVFDEFLRSQNERGLQRAIIDLSVCTGMDSTFMGTLVGHHLAMSDGGGEIVAVNPSPGNKRLLDMLGVSEVIHVIDSHAVPNGEWVVLNSSDGVSPMQRAQMMKTAHENLLRISPANEAKFTPFLQALDRDLKRLRSQDG